MGGKNSNKFASLIFVHGLTGSAKTWFDLKSKTCWPLDLLPKDIPFARIFIWEYDADIFSIWVSHHVSQNNLAAHGSNLCDRLANHRCRTATVSLVIVADYNEY